MAGRHVWVERPARRRRGRERHDELASRADASRYDHRHLLARVRRADAQVRARPGPVRTDHRERRRGWRRRRGDRRESFAIIPARPPVYLSAIRPAAIYGISPLYSTGNSDLNPWRSHVLWCEVPGLAAIKTLATPAAGVIQSIPLKILPKICTTQSVICRVHLWASGSIYRGRRFEPSY